MAESKKIKNLKEVADLLKGDLADRVELEKAEILEGLMVLAKGTYILVDEMQMDGKMKKVRSYTKLPDKDIAQYLLNQFIGKPKQNVEVSGDPERPLIVQVAPEIAAKYNLTPKADVASSPEDNSSGQSQI